MTTSPRPRPASGANARRPASEEHPTESGQTERRTIEHTLKRAAAGDQEAWRSLIDAYSSRVFGLIRAQCNNTDLAEEITQSTFCTVVVKIGEYTEVGRFEQWLFRIAMNRLRDEMRRRKRQARPVDDEALHAFADAGGVERGGAAARGTTGAAIGNSESEQFRALRAAMTQLSETDQQIIHLRHNAGLSFKDIAEVLGQPLGTVLARQHRALKKLAELLKDAIGQEPSIGKVRRSSGAAAGAEPGIADADAAKGPLAPETG